MASSEDREADDSGIGQSQSGKRAAMIGPWLRATPRYHLLGKNASDQHRSRSESLKVAYRRRSTANELILADIKP